MPARVSHFQPPWVPVRLAATVHPIALNIGGFSIHWYGILVALGFVAGMWTAARRAQRVGISGEAVFDLGTWILLGTIVGARSLYVVSYWQQDFAGQPWTHIFNLREGGLVFYGGLIGAAVAVIFHTMRKRLPLWKLADCLAPSVALGHAIGRLGCLMTGCCYGHPTNVAWAIHFPKNHWTHGVGVHPTQLYEAGLNLMLSLFLSALFKRRKFDGQVFGVYMVGYALLRSLVEAFRGDYPNRPLGGWLTPGQFVSVGIFAAGVGVLVWLGRSKPEVGTSQVQS